MQSRAVEMRPYLPRVREMLKANEFPPGGMGAIVESEFAIRKAPLRDPPDHRLPAVCLEEGAIDFSGEVPRR